MTDDALRDALAAALAKAGSFVAPAERGEGARPGITDDGRLVGANGPEWRRPEALRYADDIIAALPGLSLSAQPSGLRDALVSGPDGKSVVDLIREHAVRVEWPHSGYDPAIPVREWADRVEAALSAQPSEPGETAEIERLRTVIEDAARTLETSKPTDESLRYLAGTIRRFRDEPAAWAESAELAEHFRSLASTTPTRRRSR